MECELILGEEIPAVSVVVMAFNRRQFLSAALASLDQQSMSKDRFEVILITGFELDERISIPPSLRIMHVITPTGSMGYTLWKGITLCSADIVCLLDDDDLFFRDKLEHVVNVFNLDSRIGLYKNSVNYIDQSGIVISDSKARIKRFFRKNGCLTTSIKDPQCISKLWKVDAQFNSSSISFRRHIIEPFGEDFKRALRGPDCFILHAVLDSGSVVFADGVALTYYRVHSENVSSSTEPFESYRRWALIYAPVLKIIQDREILRMHAFLILEMRKVILLSQIKVHNSMYFQRILKRVLLRNKGGLLLYLKTHKFFGLYCLTLLLRGALFGTAHPSRFLNKTAPKEK